MSTFLSGLFGCAKSQELKAVDSVDLNKYAGKWYEIAKYPVSFEKGCSCITAEYTLSKNGYVTVTNSCKKESKIKTISGKVFVVKGSNNAKLKVMFFWPFKADYWIIALDKNYEWAVVSGPSRKYLWILSRTPVMDNDIFIQIVAEIQNKGFDMKKLEMSRQDCNN